MLAIPRSAMSEWGYNKGEAETWRSLRDASTAPSQHDSAPKHAYTSHDVAPGFGQRSNVLLSAPHHTPQAPTLPQFLASSHQALPFQDIASESIGLQDTRPTQYASSNIGAYTSQRPIEAPNDLAHYGVADNRGHAARLGDATAYAPGMSTSLRRPDNEHMPMLNAPASSRMPPPASSSLPFNPRASPFLPHQPSSGASSSGNNNNTALPYGQTYGSERALYAQALPPTPTTHHDAQAHLQASYLSSGHHHGPLQGMSSVAPLANSQHSDFTSYHYPHLGSGDFAGGSSGVHTTSHLPVHQHGQTQFGFQDYRNMPMISPFEIKHRRRTTRAQYKVLMEAFQKNHKPTAATRKALSEQTGMPLRSVQIWFQNSRAKLRREQRSKGQTAKSEEGDSPIDGPSGRLGTAESRATDASPELGASTFSRQSQGATSSSTSHFLSAHQGTSQPSTSSARGFGGEPSVYAFGSSQSSAQSDNARPSTSTLSHASTSALSDAYTAMPRPATAPLSSGAVQQLVAQQQQSTQQTPVDSWRNSSYMDSYHPEQRHKWP